VGSEEKGDSVGVSLGEVVGTDEVGVRVVGKRLGRLVGRALVGRDVGLKVGS